MNPKIRLQKQEQLDDLSLSGKDLEDTLSSLKFINAFLGNHKQLGKALLEYCKANPAKKELHIVDLGCGGGDSINYLSKKTNNLKAKVYYTGIDGNPKSIAHARKNNFDCEQINFKVADILNDDFILPECDLLISSHFIYHLKDGDLVRFLIKIQAKKIKHVIFSELYRNRIAYYLFKFMSFSFPISDIAKKDGLIAIQRAFSTYELKRNIENSGIDNFNVIKKPFFRMIITIDL